MLFFILVLLNDVSNVVNDLVNKLLLVGWVILFNFVDLFDGVKGFELFFKLFDVFKVDGIFIWFFFLVLVRGGKRVILFLRFLFFGVSFFFCLLLLLKEGVYIFVLLKLVVNLVWDFLLGFIWFIRELFFECLFLVCWECVFDDLEDIELFFIIDMLVDVIDIVFVVFDLFVVWLNIEELKNVKLVLVLLWVGNGDFMDICEIWLGFCKGKIFY